MASRDPTRLLVDGVLGAGVPGDDPGLLFGLTVFETMRTYGGVVFRLEEHLSRLEASARVLEIPCPPRAALKAELLGELEVARGGEQRVRYTLTGGGRRVLELAPLDVSRVGRPVHVATLAWEPPAFLPGAVKHGSRATWLIAARKLAVDEVLLVDREGLILEANRSNVVAAAQGALLTPPLDGRFLAGVTRGALIDAARTAGLPLREEPLSVARDYDELYLSSTLKELAPVARWDDRPAAGGGPLGRALHDAFRDLVARETGAERIDPLS